MPGFAEITISVLSSLVSSNIDHGLEYFVTMGYHEDFETRSAFLKVLANILNQGAEFDSSSDDNTDKYNKLVELLLDSDLEVVMALCDATQITEADEVAQLLTRLFEANDRTMDLLKSSILIEVESFDCNTPSYISPISYFLSELITGDENGTCNNSFPQKLDGN